MKIDKEYPATHSSDTAWFCVDMGTWPSLI